MPDPLKPGHIPGQNPNTPERLQGEMKVGERGFPWLIGLGIAAAVLVAVIVIYGTMAADPGTRPDMPAQENRSP